MSQYFVFRLWPKSPWHLGEAGVELVEANDRLHADTLYSALCNAWALLGHLNQSGLYQSDALQFSVDAPPFTLSSAFPVAQGTEVHNGECVYFWPRPLLDVAPFFRLAREDEQQAKILKNCRYVSTKLWQAFVQGDRHSETAEHRHAATFWMTAADAKIFDTALPDESFFFAGQETLTPRVALDRITSASNLYHVGRLIFSSNAGLYFLLEGEAAHAEAVALALGILQDEGLGGERAYGFGRFAMEEPEEFVESFSHIAGDKYCLLSPCSPTENEVHKLLRGDSTYQILKRTGIIQSPQRKDIPRQTIRVLAEGSVFDERPLGHVPSVKPPIHSDPPINHPVVRYGKAFAVQGKFVVVPSGTGG